MLAQCKFALSLSHSHTHPHKDKAQAILIQYINVLMSITTAFLAITHSTHQMDFHFTDQFIMKRNDKFINKILF